nr:hypothetical protein [Methanobacterium formicicum]
MGKQDASPVFDYLETALEDPHHRVRNSVMSSLKVMGEKKPSTYLEVCKKIHTPS